MGLTKQSVPSTHPAQLRSGGLPPNTPLPTLSTLFNVETPIHDGIRELVTWECKEHGVNL